MSIFGRTFTRADLNRVIWTAIQTAIGVFAAAQVTDIKTAKVAAAAAIAAAGAALLSAVKNLVLEDGSPAK